VKPFKNTSTPLNTIEPRWSKVVVLGGATTKRNNTTLLV
jgi:hypothetical protein